MTNGLLDDRVGWGSGKGPYNTFILTGSLTVKQYCPVATSNPPPLIVSQRELIQSGGALDSIRLGIILPNRHTWGVRL